AAPGRRTEPTFRGRRSGHETAIPPVCAVRTEPAIRAVCTHASRGWAVETAGHRICLPDFAANPVLRELRSRPHRRRGLLRPMRRSGPTVGDAGPRCLYGDPSLFRARWTDETVGCLGLLQEDRRGAMADHP